jgi:hypothetical protein
LSFGSTGAKADRRRVGNDKGTPPQVTPQLLVPSQWLVRRVRFRPGRSGAGRPGDILSVTETGGGRDRGMPRPIQGICSDNHRSEGSKQLSTSRCFSCQRDRHRLVSHLILKKIVELDFVILI